MGTEASRRSTAGSWDGSGFHQPYRRQLLLAILAVLAFAASQVAIPIILRSVIDDALVKGADDERLLALGVLVFFGIVTLNFLANLVQETRAMASGQRIFEVLDVPSRSGTGPARHPRSSTARSSSATSLSIRRCQRRALTSALIKA